MDFTPAIPQPYKENWREAYRYDKDDTPRLSAYQPPGGKPVPFVQESIKYSGGQSVDTGEYPYFGYWSNVTLNEKTHTITVSGSIRGETYIVNRNNMVEALRIKTDDETPGYLDLPLWGRFPVVVAEYDVEEKGRENGQCAVSLTFKRAGVPLEERWGFAGDYANAAVTAGENLEASSVKRFKDRLKVFFDANAMAANFNAVTKTLLDFTGRIQGARSKINNITGSVMNLTTLISRGTRAPVELSQALFGAAAGIVSGLMEIKNSADETVAYFRTRDNIKNMLLLFFSSDSYTTGAQAITVNEYATKEETENLFKTVALAAAGQILLAEEDVSYQQALGYWDMFRRLEDSVKQDDPAVYRALEDMRIALAQAISSRNMMVELNKNIPEPSPLLHVSHSLGCDDETLRRLNMIEDAFLVRGSLTYV